MTEQISWVDLPKPKPLFTKRNALMVNLDDGEIIQYYSANTKIQVVQKASCKGITYYRTASAKERGLNWAFKAAAFGLPNDEAPLAPVPFSQIMIEVPGTLYTTPVMIQKPSQKEAPLKSGEGESPRRSSLLARLFKWKKEH